MNQEMPAAERKAAYAKYLESAVWKRLRKAALERDVGKCQACGKPAQQVHHSRYPSVWGEERMVWLHSVCVPCHGAIHSLVDRGMSLRAASRKVLAGQVQHRQKKKPKRRKKNRVTDDSLRRLQAHFANHRAADVKLKLSLADENEQMRRTLAANRERRERRQII